MNYLLVFLDKKQIEKYDVKKINKDIRYLKKKYNIKKENIFIKDIRKAPKEILENLIIPHIYLIFFNTKELLFYHIGYLDNGKTIYKNKYLIR